MTDDIRKKIFRTILLIRRVEERIAAVYGEQEMRCPVHLCIGQEAIASGVCAALETTDRVFSTHRSHGHYLAKGGNLDAMIAEIYGKETGCCGGKGGSMHLIDPEAGFMGAVPIVGSTIPIAVGSAFASHYSKDSAVTAVFFGEGAREEGVFHESMNFAALHKLPVLFVCENNLYSVYTPLNARQPERYDSVAHAWSYGINAFRGDGNDGDAVYRMAAESVSRIRKGGGPEYLEFATYRWREHCGPNYDNDIGYRTEDEFKAWETLCPLRTLKDTLIRDGLLTDDGVAEWERDITGEIDRAFSRARQSPFPSLDGLANRVYSGQRNGG